MKKKQYKVKIENGQVIPLEPFDLDTPKEGIIIFFELEGSENVSDKSTAKSLLKYAGQWKGTDIEECLEQVYKNRKDAEF